MPFGPGTYGPVMGGAGAAGDPSASLAGGGMPTGVLGGQVPDEAVLSELVQMLRGGQVGAERFMQLLSLLVGSTVPEAGQPPGQPQQAQPQQAQAPQGAPSITDLLG